MRLIEESILIRRRPDEVFGFVEDLQNEPLWHARTLEASFLDQGPNRVGRRGRELVKFPGRRVEFVLEITIYEPPSQIGVRVVEGPYAGEQLFRCEAEGDGCRLTNIFPRPTIEGLAGTLAAPLLAWLAAREARSDLRKLREILEAETLHQDL